MIIVKCMDGVPLIAGSDNEAFYLPTATNGAMYRFVVFNAPGGAPFEARPSGGEDITFGGSSGALQAAAPFAPVTIMAVEGYGWIVTAPLAGWALV